VSPRPRRTEQKTADDARRLVEATFEVIASAGNIEPSVRPILNEAGLSRETFYRCFESKDHLMQAVIAEGRQLLIDHLNARMARADDAESKVRAWISGVMRQAETAQAAKRTRPFAATAGQRAVIDPAVLSETDRLLSAPLRKAIEEGMADGLFVSDDPEADALIIQDYVLASQRRHLVVGRAPSRATTDSLVAFACRALGARSHTMAQAAP
jgi:AcrR family transcriptional regulator